VTDRRVKKIIATIGREKVDVEIIERAIRSLDTGEWIEIGRRPWLRNARNKREQLIALSFGRAFLKLEKRLDEHENRLKDDRHQRHAQAVLEQSVLDRVFRGFYNEFIEWKMQLTSLRECLEDFGGKTKPEPKGLLPYGSTTRIRKPSKAWKHDADKATAQIFEAHGLRITATRKSERSKGSLFCQVAAIMSGDQSIYHQCREFIKTRNRAPK
jgi:hypothetical protein